MSPYVKGTRDFAYATFASMIGPNVSEDPRRKKIQGRAIILAHDDLHDGMAVGGFSNFANMFRENGIDATGNRVYDDSDALRMIEVWRRQNPNILDLSIERGCQSFTTLVVLLVAQNIFTVDSVIKHARNSYNMKSVLIEKGLLKKSSSFSPGVRVNFSCDLEDTSSGNVRVFESSSGTFDFTKNNRLQSSKVERAFESRSSSFAFDKNALSSDISTPASNVFNDSSLDNVKLRLKDNSESLKKLNDCFIDSDSESDGVQRHAKKARRNIQFPDDSRVKSEEVSIDLTEPFEEEMMWKQKYKDLLSQNQSLIESIELRSKELEQANGTISSLEQDLSDSKIVFKVKLEEAEKNAKVKIDELQGTIDSLKDCQGEEVVVSKSLFETLLENVSKIDKAVSNLPNKGNLKNAVDYIDSTIESKLVVMKKDFKEMVSSKKTRK